MFSKPDYIILIAAMEIGTKFLYLFLFYFRFLYGSACLARKIEMPEFSSDYGFPLFSVLVFSLRRARKAGRYDDKHYFYSRFSR